MRVILTILSIGTFCTLSCSEAIGIFKNVSGDVSVVRTDMKKLTPQSGDKLYESDIVKTGVKATAGMIFNDNTLVSIGQNSEFAVKEYNFIPSEKKGTFVGNMVKGTMACITGLIAKMNPESMKIETKTATIGIRGTYFVVEVPE